MNLKNFKNWKLKPEINGFGEEKKTDNVEESVGRFSLNDILEIKGNCILSVAQLVERLTVVNAEINRSLVRFRAER